MHSLYFIMTHSTEREHKSFFARSRFFLKKEKKLFSGENSHLSSTSYYIVEASPARLSTTSSLVLSHTLSDGSLQARTKRDFAECRGARVQKIMTTRRTASSWLLCVPINYYGVVCSLHCEMNVGMYVLREARVLANIQKHETRHDEMLRDPHNTLSTPAAGE